MKEALRLILTKELDADILAAVGKVEDEEELIEAGFVQIVRYTKMMIGNLIDVESAVERLEPK